MHFIAPLATKPILEFTECKTSTCFYTFLRKVTYLCSCFNLFWDKHFPFPFPLFSPWCAVLPPVTIASTGLDIVLYSFISKRFNSEFASALYSNLLHGIIYYICIHGLLLKTWNWKIVYFGKPHREMDNSGAGGLFCACVMRSLTGGRFNGSIKQWTHWTKAVAWRKQKLKAIHRSPDYRQVIEAYKYIQWETQTHSPKLL